MSNLREIIAEILDLPNNNSWQIVDAKPEVGLYLIHSTPEASMVRYGSLQGVVVDVPNRTIIARGYGFTPTVVATNLEVRPYDQQIHLRDALNPNVNYQIDPNTTIFVPNFDGILVRVFLHQGIVYYSTSRRLNGSQLRFGSRSLLEIYTELNGPSSDILFDLDADYSPYVHLFILADPMLQIASKTPVGRGYLVYLGAYQIWDPESAPYHQVDTTDRTLEATVSFNANPIVPVLYTPSNLNLDEVNQHLNFGFYQPFDLTGIEDPRLLPGESVLAFLEPESGLIGGVIQIVSPAYQWRYSLRNNNPNLLHQFYLLSNGKFIQAQYEDELEVYIRKFPILTPYDQESLVQLGPITVWPQEPLTQDEINQILANSNHRLYNIFLCFYLALPESFQPAARNLYQEYMSNLKQVRDWIVQLYREGTLQYELAPPRLRQILAMAMSNSQRRLEANENTLSFDDLVADEINRLIHLEEGASLFRLFRSATGCNGYVETTLAEEAPLII